MLLRFGAGCSIAAFDERLPEFAALRDAPEVADIWEDDDDA